MRTALKSLTITQHDVFMFHPCCSVCQNVIPFYGCVVFHDVNFCLSIICWWTFACFHFGYYD